MRLRKAAVTLTIVLSGCGDEELEPARGSSSAPYSFSVVDAPEPLTSNPSDRLFRLKLVSGARLDPKELAVTAELPSQTKHVYTNLALDDLNGNGSFDVGETLLVIEGGVNTFSEIHASQDARVGVLRFGKADPKTGVEIASGSWSTK